MPAPRSVDAIYKISRMIYRIFWWGQISMRRRPSRPASDAESDTPLRITRFRILQISPSLPVNPVNFSAGQLRQGFFHT